MTHGLWVEGRREDLGPSDNGEEAGKTLGSNSGEPLKALSECLAKAGHGRG